MRRHHWQPVHFYAERVNRRFTFQQILKGIVEAIAALVDLLRNGFPLESHSVTRTAHP